MSNMKIDKIKWNKILARVSILLIMAVYAWIVAHTYGSLMEAEAPMPPILGSTLAMIVSGLPFVIFCGVCFGAYSLYEEMFNK